MLKLDAQKFPRHLILNRVEGLIHQNILRFLMKKRVHVYYTGRVQGVGFRFTTESIACNLSVTGWVKNLSDGSVEVMAEADEDALTEFLQRIYGIFSRHIQDVQIDWQEPTGEFKDFSLKY